MAKSPSKQSQISTLNFIPSILILALLSVGFIPNLEAVDKIAPQWLYLSILNLICGIYLYLNRKNFVESISSVISSKISISYIAFVLWAALSYFYAVNSTEVLVNIVRHFNTLFMFLYLEFSCSILKTKIICCQ